MKKLLFLLPFIWNCKPDAGLAISPKIVPSKTINVPANPPAVKTINFGGYSWIVKSGKGIGPGPNVWGEDNVWVDDAGILHLKLSYDTNSGKWLCAGITTTKELGYGTYQWMIQGPISALDKNVVTGLFHYSGPDGYNEIDVEFARWGDTSKPNVNYSVYPAAGTVGKQQSGRSEWAQSGGTSSTHRYTWSEKEVVFKSMNGFHNDDTNMFATHTVTSSAVSIPTAKMPVKINLWCFKGMPPSNGKEVEITVRSFKFTPAL